MARSECVALVVSLSLAGCLVQDRPLAPEVADVVDGGSAGAPSTVGVADVDAGGAHTARDAGGRGGEASVPPRLARDSGPTQDASVTSPPPSQTPPVEPPPDTSTGGIEPASVDASTPRAADATTPREADAAVVTPPTTPAVWCRREEEGCIPFDFESEPDADGYFGPFWCHPDGDCRGKARPALELPGSTNHLWVSAVSGSDAKALGTAMNVSSYKRTVYRHAEIDFDVWPVTAVNEESAVWFALIRVDPQNQGHPLISLVSTHAGTYVVLGPVYSPELKLRFMTPPAGDARSHVRIVLDRIDDERSSALITYGSETIRLASIAMPLRDSSGAAAYDTTLGLFDGQAQRSVGAPAATARYDNFVARTTFIE